MARTASSCARYRSRPAVRPHIIWMSDAAIAPAWAEALPPPGVGVAAASASVNCSSVILDNIAPSPRNRCTRRASHLRRTRPVVGMEIYRPAPGLSRSESAGSLVRRGVRGMAARRSARDRAVLDHHPPVLHDGAAVVHPEMVDQMEVVRDLQNLRIGRLPDLQAPGGLRQSKCVGRVQ